jgi:carboxyl-terminal processing protease
MTFLRAFLLTLLAGALLAGSFAAGFLLHAHRSQAANFPIFNQAYEILSSQGLKPTPASPALEYGMIRGLLQAYDDPYSIFVAPAQHELESNALQGSFGGIGVRMGKDAQGEWVLFPIPGGPAAQAGVADGDRLLAIEDLAVDSRMPSDQIQSSVRGPVGQRIKITIGRPPQYKPLQLSVRRAEIPLPSVTWHLDPSDPTVGIVEINLIAASTTGEVQQGFKDLQARGATQFLLDLRDNPGGLLTAGVDVARLFLNDGIVIQEQYRGKPQETFLVERPGPLVELPLAVMINHGSASAAEIIAGALQAHHRAQLVGSASYGKDTVQLVYDLKDGSSLHITAAHWWVPGLEPSLAGNGLQPDIPVNPPSDTSAGPDPVIQAAIQALKQTK